jgi:ABC-2 type transport system permease protein
MVLTMARQEWRTLRRDRRVFALAVSVLVLAALAAAGGAVRQRAVHDERARAAAADRSAWLAQPGRNSHVAAHYGGFAVKPTSALALFDPGVEPFTGTLVRMEAHRQADALFSPARTTGGLARFGQLTPALVLQTLLPLVVIFAGFGLVCGEREQGTLAMLCAQGVTTRQLVMGKYLALLAVIWALALPVLLVGGGLMLMTHPDWVADDLVRVGAWSVLHLLYLAIVVAVTVLVSSRAETSRSSLVTSLAVWTLCVLLLPKAAANIGAGWHPLPSRAAFDAAVARDAANGIDGHAPDEARRAVIVREALVRHGVSRVEDLPVNVDGLVQEASEAHSTEVYRRHFTALHQTMARQNRLTELTGLVNPFVATRALSMSLAGTDYPHHVAFHLAAEDHRRQMVTTMNRWLTQETRTGDWETAADPSLWATVPSFDYAPPTVGTALGARSAAAAGLGLHLVGSLGLLAWVAGRVRVVAA